MATTQNRTFFGGSTAPGSGVYPEDVKILKVYKNYAETDYDPLAGSDTSVYIPTVEKVDSSGTSIQVTIQKILASSGYPVLVFNNEEYQYIATSGTPSKYIFMCLSDLSTLKRVEVDVSTGTISSSSNTIAGVNYIGRSASNIYTKIANTFTQNRLPVLVDDSDYYQLSYAWNGVVKFTRVDEDDGSVHILSINSSNTITETVVQGAEILKIVKATPEASGLTVAEYDAISSAKMACLYYGSGSTTSYAYIQSYGTTTTFIHQTSTGYDVFSVAPSPTPVDPLDPDSELRHVVTKTSYTYGSSAMTMRNFEALDATDSVNTHAAFPLGNDEFWVMEDWDGGWNNPNYYVMVAPSDSDNNCVVRFENVTTSYFTSGYPIEIWNHSKNAQLTPLDGSLTVMKADCSYEIRIYGDKYYCYETVSQGTGGTIYPSLQSAIADAANLSVGDIFETNGFHTSGDGGAARYLVSDTGTANGMDIVQLSAGKLAIVQLKGSAYTEQIGYEVSSAQADVTPYISRLLALGVQNVKFYPTGGAPTKCYCIRDTLDLDRSDYHNVGIQLEGADIGQTSGYATWFNFQPSVSNTDKVAIKIHARTTRIKNIAIIYGAGVSDASVRDNSAAICFDSTGNTSYKTSSYGTVLENLTIQGFNTAILSMGTAPYIWHVDCEKITCSANNTHVSLDGLSYCTTFRNCLFNSPDVQSVYLGEPVTVKFDSCNFGIDDRGTCIIRAVNWVVDSAPVDEKRGLVLFQNCNMEVEYRSISVPQNNRHLFIYADDDSLIDYEFDNCCFIYTPLTRENITSDRMMSLGAGSSIIIRNSIGPYSDVNYTNNEFYENDYDKYFFDESRPPEKKIGSLRLEHVVGIDPLVFLDSSHLPCLKRDDDVILYDNNTNLAQFKGLGDGTILFNLDTFVPVVKVAGQLQTCASAPSGVVRIGNELYDYVTIDGRKWITRNLNLRIATRQHTIWNHLEWGQYYKYNDLSAIQSALPSGWRIPNATDVASLIGDGTSARAHDLQSLGVSYWPSATNSTGFSALPSTWWYKPNTTPHSTFKQYAFYWTTVTEGSNVKNISIAPDAVSSGGWSSGEAASLWIPLRVCADA